ncbi:MAG: flagellar hook capping FlgD N-terminal domain-containing protein [Arcobacteraceae bacterium]|jgi:flagellar basal-body rod modification protein FlgD|nr:hypothetical protein [Arcobacteraceae bacterium]MDY0365545.1 flagellar hook capping FlgD N-terminal domain-containing protein [Arcobacteraceae bacterium]
MAIDSVQVQSNTDRYGNSYTSSVANDKLTNNDFLKLMLTELQMQDPTKPMDTQSMLQSQMQMSAIETNLQTIETMKALQHSFAQGALAQSANLIGHIVENGEFGENGMIKEFYVNSIESVDGDIMLSVGRVLGYDSDNGEFIISSEQEYVNFNNITRITKL